VTTPTLPPQQPQPDPRGWLAFTEPLPDDLQRGEDSCQHHDFYGAHDGWRSEQDPVTGVWVEFFERPDTDTERTLLAALGYTLPAELVTRVSFPSALVRRRRWLALETTTEGSPTP
jgi:hypothetical protein